MSEIAEKLPARSYVVFNAAGDALWLKRDTDWPSLPRADLSLAEFTNMAWEAAARRPVGVDLATKVWRDGDLPLIDVRPAPAGHAVVLAAEEQP